MQIYVLADSAINQGVPNKVLKITFMFNHYGSSDWRLDIYFAFPCIVGRQLCWEDNLDFRCRCLYTLYGWIKRVRQTKKVNPSFSYEKKKKKKLRPKYA